MTPTVAGLVWLAGLIGWIVIRYPYQRRARKLRVVAAKVDLADRASLAFSGITLAVVPAVWLLAGFPAALNRPFAPALAGLGALAMVSFLWLFYRSHHDLGRNWSVTMEIRENHRLVTAGVYRTIRHPMYAAFWLWAIAQALLIANWLAGLAGLVGVALLYFGRVHREEALMVERFGNEYRDYVRNSARLIPFVY